MSRDLWDSAVTAGWGGEGSRRAGVIRGGAMFRRGGGEEGCEGVVEWGGEGFGMGDRGMVRELVKGWRRVVPARIFTGRSRNQSIVSCSSPATMAVPRSSTK